MKKLLLLITSLFLMSASAMADDPTTITFNAPSPNPTSGYPTGNHAPARRIFSGYYDSSAGAVAIFCLENIGQVTITVDGPEGTVAAVNADTAFGEAIVNVPTLTTGTYTVTITTASGGVYLGYFSVN